MEARKPLTIRTKHSALSLSQRDILRRMSQTIESLVVVSTWYWAFASTATFGRHNVPSWSADKGSLKILLARGYVAQVDSKTIVLTDAGRAAIEASDAQV